MIRMYGSRSQGALSALATGASQGLGLGIGMRERRLEREQEDRQFAERMKLAEDEAAREEAEEGRRKELFEIAKSRREQGDEAAQGIAGMALGPEPLGPVQEDPEDAHARRVASKLPAEMLPRFLEGYRNVQTQKMLTSMKEKHLSQWEELSNDPELANLSPKQQEAALKRSQEAMELLGSAQDPEQLTEILKTSAKGLTDTRTLIGKRVQAAEEKARIIGFYQPELAEMQAMTKGLPPDIASQMQERIDILSKGLAGYQAGAITPTQLQAFWHNAKGGARPDGQRGGRGQQYTRSDAIEDARRELGPSGDVRTRADELYRERSGQMPRQEGIGQGPRAPAASDFEMGRVIKDKPRPKLPPVSFAKVKPEAQSAMVDAIKADMLQGGQNLEAIFAAHNVDPETLPEDVLKALLGSPKAAGDAKSKARASKLEKVGPNF